MVYQYVVTLKNNNRRYIDIFSLLLLAVSVLLFVRQQWFFPNTRAPYLYGISIAVIAICAWNRYQEKRTGRTVFYSHALFIAAIGWITMDYLQWLIVPFVLLALVERTAKKPLEIGFTDTKIVVNTLFRRKYLWSDLSNIVLRDDLLTLDFKNNRLLQRETVDDESDAGEDEFNAYCREQLLCNP